MLWVLSRRKDPGLRGLGLGLGIGLMPSLMGLAISMGPRSVALPASRAHGTLPLDELPCAAG